MRNLNWFELGHGADKASVEAVEAAVGFQLPDDFVAFATQYAGASNPDECEFDIVEPDNTVHFGNFGSLLQLVCDETENVIGTIENLGDRIPSGIVPIVGTGSGDYVCLDFRARGMASITYFFHERVGAPALVPLAPTFADFLEMLREPQDEL